MNTNTITARKFANVDSARKAARRENWKLMELPAGVADYQFEPAWNMTDGWHVELVFDTTREVICDHKGCKVAA